MRWVDLVLAFVCLAVTSAQLSCSNGWIYHDGGCYYFSKEKHNWINSLMWCHALGGRLVELTDVATSSWVTAQANAMSGDDWWIGLTDVESEGEFIWTDTRLQAKFTFMRWNIGEPNGGTRENCVQLNNRGYWNDNRCSSSYRYICEKGTGPAFKQQRRRRVKVRRRQKSAALPPVADGGLFPPALGPALLAQDLI